MKNNNDAIMSSQVFSIIINVIIGLDILSLPGVLAETVGPDSLWVLVLGCIGFIICLWMVTKIITMNPNKNLIELGDSLVCKYFGTLLAIVFIVYSILQLSLQVRAFADIVKNFLLFNTPLEIIMITYLLMVMYVARSGIECIARMSAIIVFFSLVPMISAMVFALPDLDLTTFLPLFDIKLNAIKMGIFYSLLSFRGFEFLLIYGHFIKDTDKLRVQTKRAGYMISLIYLFITLVTIARFGVVQVKTLLWPVLTLFKSIDLPGGLIENVEVIIMSTWVTSVFLSTGILMFSVSTLMALVTRSKEHNFWVVALIPITIIIGLLPKNIAQVYDIAGKIGHTLGFTGAVVIPFILLVMSYYRARRRKRNA